MRKSENTKRMLEKIDELIIEITAPTIMDESYQSPTRIAALSELIKARAAIE